MGLKITGTALPGEEQPIRAQDAAGTEAQPVLPGAVQDHLGGQLRALYASFIAEALPTTLRALLAKLEADDLLGEADARAEFTRDLLTEVPALRAYALSLAFSGQADDLVQETLLKAWQSQRSFQPGTNLKAWLFTIQRNLFYSHHRRRRREVADVDGVLALQLADLPNQEHAATLVKVRRELGRLPPSQREAVILVGAQGLTYEAAADLLHCRVGTVKSRVSRGRAALSGALGLSAEPRR